MTQTRSGRLAACCSPLAARPSSLEPTRGWHGAADRFLIATRPALIPAAVLLGVLAGQVADALPSRYAMLPALVFFLELGGWCGLNFARCREAHCLITGAAFGGLAIAALVAVGLDRNWYNLLSLMIVPVVFAAFVFEAAWQRRQGSNAVRFGRSGAARST
jgi:hypothetical protein